MSNSKFLFFGNHQVFPTCLKILSPSVLKALIPFQACLLVCLWKDKPGMCLFTLMWHSVIKWNIKRKFPNSSRIGLFLLGGKWLKIKSSIRRLWKTNTWSISYTIGAFALGGLFGSLATMFTNRFFGRRDNIMISCAWFIAGGLLSSVSINIGMVITNSKYHFSAPFLAKA